VSLFRILKEENLVGARGVRFVLGNAIATNHIAGVAGGCVVAIYGFH
jgi:hypothetical protein